MHGARILPGIKCLMHDVMFDNQWLTVTKNLRIKQQYPVSYLSFIKMFGSRKNKFDYLELVSKICSFKLLINAAPIYGLNNKY